MNCHRLNHDSDVRTLLRVVVSDSRRAVVTPYAIWDERDVLLLEALFRARGWGTRTVS